MTTPPHEPEQTIRPVPIADIQRAVCERFGVRMIDMIAHRRQRDLSRPRQIAMYLSRELTSRSLPEIGRMFGGRDHTTVLHACRRIEMLTSIDPELAEVVANLAAHLRDPNQMVLALA